jgi:uncharacterized protein YjbI with pentapeptide repeats
MTDHEYSLRDTAHSSAMTRARTLSLLRRLTIPPLDTERKGSVLQFLYESRLLDKDNCIIDLGGADLSGVDLHNTNLQKANLTNVNLSEANLRGANLSEADLSGADLRGANLEGAMLIKVDLREADLGGTNVQQALTLDRTDLRRVKGLEEQQRDIYKSKGAIIDGDTTTSSSQSTGASSSSSQSNDEQVPSAPLAQGSVLSFDPVSGDASSEPGSQS